MWSVDFLERLDGWKEPLSLRYFIGFLSTARRVPRSCVILQKRQMSLQPITHLRPSLTGKWHYKQEENCDWVKLSPHLKDRHDGISVKLSARCTGTSLRKPHCFFDMPFGPSHLKKETKWWVDVVVFFFTSAGGQEKLPAGVPASPTSLLPRRTTLMTSAGVKVAISSTSSLWDKYSSTRLSSDVEDSCSEGAGEETWPDDDTHSPRPPYLSSTFLRFCTPSWSRCHPRDW